MIDYILNPFVLINSMWMITFIIIALIAGLFIVFLLTKKVRECYLIKKYTGDEFVRAHLKRSKK